MSWGAIFDPVLALALVGLAWLLLSSPDLFKSVVLFVVFGLLTALAWIRLGAPDLALAEAAIGAGITGALFLSALDVLDPASGEADPSGETAGRDDGAAQP